MSEKVSKFLTAVRVTTLVSIGAMAALSLMAWGQIPAGTLVPTHWGLSGQADGFAPKEIALWMIPAITAFVGVIFDVTLSRKSKEANLEKSLAVAGVSMFGTVALMVVVQGLIVFSALGHVLPVAQVVSAGLGVMLAATGLLIAMGKTSRNTAVDVRTPWTLSSDKAWVVTSRFSGSVMLAMGVAALVGALLNSMVIITVSLVGGVLVLLVGSYAVSYLVARSEQSST